MKRQGWKRIISGLLLAMMLLTSWPSGTLSGALAESGASTQDVVEPIEPVEQTTDGTGEGEGDNATPSVSGAVYVGTMADSGTTYTLKIKSGTNLNLPWDGTDQYITDPGYCTFPSEESYYFPMMEVTPPLPEGYYIKSAVFTTKSGSGAKSAKEIGETGTFVFDGKASSWTIGRPSGGASLTQADTTASSGSFTIVKRLLKMDFDMSTGIHPYADSPNPTVQQHIDSTIKLTGLTSYRDSQARSGVYLEGSARSGLVSGYPLTPGVDYYIKRLDGHNDTAGTRVSLVVNDVTIPNTNPTYCSPPAGWDPYNGNLRDVINNYYKDTCYNMYGLYITPVNNHKYYEIVPNLSSSNNWVGFGGSESLYSRFKIMEEYVEPLPTPTPVPTYTITFDALTTGRFSNTNQRLYYQELPVGSSWSALTLPIDPTPTDTNKYFVGWNETVPSSGLITGDKTFTAVYADKAPLEIKANDKTKVYDGTALTPDTAGYTLSVAGVTASGVTLSGTLTNVGTAVATIGGTITLKEGTKDVTNKYKVSLTNGTLSVTKKPVTLSLPATITGTPANGTDDAGWGVVASASPAVSVPPMSKLVYTVTATGKNGETYPEPGEYAVAITAPEASNPNYNITVDNSNGNMTIAAQEFDLIFDAGDGTFPGGGDTHTVPVDLDTPWSTVPGQVPDPTPNDDDYYFDGWNPIIPANGNVDSNGPFRFEAVYARKTDLTITANDKNKIYDGTALTPDANGYTVSLQTVTVSGVTLSGTITDAGSEAAVVGGTIAVSDATGDVTGKYKVIKVDGTLTVTKKPITLTLPATITGKPNNNSNDAAWGVTIAADANPAYASPPMSAVNYTVVATSTGGTTYPEAGTYTVNINAPAASNPNYSITVSPARTMTILPDEYELTFNGGAGTFPGGGTTHTVTTPAGTNWTDIPGQVPDPTPTDSENYYFDGWNPSIPDSGIVDENGPFVFDAIYTRKTALEIKANDKDKVYDGNPLVPDANGYTVSPSVTVEGVTLGGSITNAGTEAATVGGTIVVREGGEDVTHKYKITRTNGTLEVTRKPVSLSLPQTIPGTPQTQADWRAIVISDPVIASPMDAVDYTVSATAPGLTYPEPGTYTVTIVEGTNPNYIVTVDGGSRTMTINPDTLSVTYLAGENGTLTGQSVYSNVPYGATLGTAAPAPTVTANSGYHFVAWQPNWNASHTVTENMEFVALYVAIARATYTIEYYLQDPDDPANYVLGFPRTGTGEVNQLAEITDADLNLPQLAGYDEHTTHPNRVVSAPIKADNSTVLAVYFNCKTFDVTYGYADGSEYTGATLPQAQTVRYGQTVTIADNLTHATFKFTGWQTADKDYFGASITGGAGNTFAMPAGNVAFLGSFTSKDVLTVRANSLETFYDGTTQSVSGYTIYSGSTVVPNITLEGLPQGAVSASGKNSATYNATVDLSKVTGITLNSNTDVTDNYLLVSEDGSLVIKPREVQIWVNPDTRDWGSDVEDKLQIEPREGDRGVIDGETIYLMGDKIQMLNTDATSDAVFDEPGVYKPVLIPDDSRNKNYIVEVINTTNTITINALPYTIEYYFQNETLSGYAKDPNKADKTAYGYGTVSARPEDLEGITGFTYNEAMSTPITLPDETVLKLYFDRNIYKVTYEPGAHGTLSGTTTYDVAFGLPVVAPGRPTPDVTPDEDYYFDTWRPDPDASIVSGPMTFTAQYVAVVRATYRIEYYLQDITDLQLYNMAHYEERSAEVNSNVQVTAADLSLPLLTGFYENDAHPGTVTSATVRADNSTALKVYFNRNSYQVTYGYAPGSVYTGEALPQPQPVRYGQTVTIAANLIHDQYKFTGWQTADKDYYGVGITGGAGQTFMMPAGDVAFTGAFSDRDVLIVRGNTKESVYDGTMQKVTGYTILRADNLQEVTDVTLVGLSQAFVSASGKDVGVYDLIIDTDQVTRIMQGGKDATDSYLLIPENGSLKITRRPVKVWVESDDRPWDGEVSDTLQVEPFSSTGRGVVDGETIYLIDDTIKMLNTDPSSTASYPQPGTYRPVIQLDDARNGNYIVEKAEPTNTITIRPLPYAIEYYFQDEDLGGYTHDETKDKQATGYDTVGARPEDLAGIEGFTFNEAMSTPITLPSSEPLKLYFDRNIYKVTYDAGANGTMTGTASYDVAYGLPVVDDATRPVPTITPNKDFYFVGWEPNPEGETVDGNKLYTAQYVAVVRSTYKIEYYLQDLNDLQMYNKAHTVERSEEVGEEVTVTDADRNLSLLNGFDENETHPGRVITAVVSGEGTTTLKLYFDRHAYTVRYEYTADSEHTGVSLPQEETILYGRVVTIAQNLAHDTYKFTGWQTQDKDYYGNNITGGAGKAFAMPAGDVTFQGGFTTREVLVVRANSLETFYTGQTQTVTGYTIYRADGVTEMTDISLTGLTPASVTASGKDAGEYDLEIDLSQVRVIMQGTTDVTETYLLTRENGTLLIKPRHVKIWANPDTRTWGSDVDDKIQIEQRNGDRGIIAGETIHLVGDAIQMLNRDPDSSAVFPEPGKYRPVLIPDDSRNGNYIVEVDDTDATIWIKPVVYTIEYYFQNLEDENYTKDGGRTKTAEGFGTVSARPEDLTGIEGFTYNAALSVPIDLKNEKTLKLYFDRGLYTIQYLPGSHGQLTGTTSYSQVPYGAAVVTADRSIPSVIADAGYFHSQWLPAVGSGTTVTGNMTFIAQYSVQANGSYNIEYYLQSLTDETAYEKHTYVGKGVGTIGTTATVRPEDLTLALTEGFTHNERHAQSQTSVTIAADGSAALRLYFDRNSYNVSYGYTDDSANKTVALPGTLAVKYGQTVTIAENLAHQDYAFTGWHTGDKDASGAAITGGAGQTFTMPAHAVAFTGGFTDREVLTVRANSLEAIYNGSQQAVTGYKIYKADGTETSGIVLVGLTQGAIGRTERNAGTYDVPVAIHSGVQVRENGVLTDKYLLVPENGTLIITPRPVNVWVKSAEKAYDGAGVENLLQVEANSPSQNRGLIPGDTIYLVGDVINMINVDPASANAYPEMGVYRPVIELDHAKNTNYVVTDTTDALTRIVITDADYTIEYYFQNLMLNGYDLGETRVGRGSGRIEVGAEHLTGITGFELNRSHPDSVLVVYVTSGSVPVMKLYFDRSIYTIRYEAGAHGNIDGTSGVAYKIPYGLAMIAPSSPVPTPVAATGYHFSGWQPNPNLAQFATVTQDRTFTAQYVAVGNASYTIEYYLQDVDDVTEYNRAFTRKGMGMAGTMAQITDSDRNLSDLRGFTENAAHAGTITSALIKDDGTTVLRLYFDRETYQVTYGYRDESESKNALLLPSAQTVRYGQTVTIADDITEAGMQFTGWQTDAKDYAGGSITGGAGATFQMPAGNVRFLGAFTSREVLLVRANSLVTYYNGETQQVSGYTIVNAAGTVMNNITLDSLDQTDVLASGLDAGEYDVGIDLSKVTAVRNSGTDVTAQYTLVKENGTLTIQRRPVQIWVESDVRNWGAPVKDVLSMQPRQGNAGLIPGDTIYLLDDIIRMQNVDPDSSAAFPQPGVYSPVLIPDEARNGNYVVEVINTSNTVTIKALPYTIEYYFMDENMTTYTKDGLRTKTAEGFGIVGPRPEDLVNVEGFTLRESPTIDLAEENVLRLYFNRNQYVVTYLPGSHGSLSQATTYQVPYNSLLVTTGRPTPSVTPDDGYFHSGWTPALTTGLRVREDMTITAMYSVKADGMYRIEYYLQSIEDEDTYALSDYVRTESAQVGQTVSTTPADLNIPATTGFTYNARHEGNVSSVEVTDDGQAALKLYYTRNSYDVTYDYTSDSLEKDTALLPTAQRMKYGQTVTIADDLDLPLLNFTGWTTTAKDMAGVAINGGAGTTFEMPAGGVAFLGGFTDKDVLTIQANSLEAIYDGTNKTASGYTIFRADGSMAEGITLVGLSQGSVSRTEKDAGVYEVALTIGSNVTVRENGRLTDDYTLVAKPGTLRIAQRPVYVWVRAAQKVYDGFGVADLLQIEARNNDRGLILGDKIHLVDDVIQMINEDPAYDSVYPEPGTYRPIVKLDEEKNGNYLVELINDKNRIVILPTDLDGDFVIDNEVEYDGQPHGVELSDDIPDGDVLYLHDDGEWKPEPVTITDVDEGPKNVLVKVDQPNGNSTIASGTITITPRKINIIAQPATMVYTGDPYETTGSRRYIAPDDTIADYVTVDQQAPLVSGQKIGVVTITSLGVTSHGGAQPVNVGEYDENLTPSNLGFLAADDAVIKASNYEIIRITDGKLEITKRKTTYEPDDPDNFVSDNDPIYDGEEHGVIIDPGKLPEGDITYSDDGGNTWKPNPPTITDVDEGPKEIWVKVENENEEIIGKGTVDVQLREISLAAKDQEMVYTGSPYGGSGEKTFAAGTADAPQAAVTIGGNKGLAPDQLIKTVVLESQPHAEAGNAVPVGAGTYGDNLLPKDLVIVDAQGADTTDNYRITGTTNGALEITKKKTTYEPDDPDNFVGDNDDVYDDTGHGIELLPNTPDGDITYSDDGGKTWQKDPIEITEVDEGPKDVWVKVENENEIIIGKGTVDVTPRRVTITANDDTMVFSEGPYNGTGSKHYQAGTMTNPTTSVTVGGTDGLVSGQHIEAVTVASQRYPNASGTLPIHVGTYATNLLPTDVEIVRANGQDVTKNYDITAVRGMLEITKRKTTYEPDDPGNFVTDNEGLYDGDEHGVDVDLTEVPDGDVSYSDDGGKTWQPNPPTITDVDEGPKEIWVKVETDDEEIIGKGVVTLNPRAITITAQDDAFIYNKRAYNATGSKAYKAGTDLLPLSGVSLSGTDGLAPNQTLDGVLVTSANPRPVNVGVHTGNLVPSAATIADRAGADVTKNYTVTYANGTLEITKRKVVLSFRDGDKDKDYDGRTDTPTWQIAISGDGVDTGLVSGDRIVYALDFDGNGTYPEVGDYDVTIEPNVQSNPNYEVEVSKDIGSLIIYGRVTYSSDYPSNYPQSGSWADATYMDPTRYKRDQTVTTMTMDAVKKAAPAFQDTGLTFSSWDDSGTTRQQGSTFPMGAKGNAMNANWQKRSYTLTVQHRVEGSPNTAVAVDQTFPMEYGQTYNVPAATVSRYTALTPNVTGVMPANDLTVTIYYSLNNNGGNNGGGTNGGGTNGGGTSGGGTSGGGTGGGTSGSSGGNNMVTYTIMDSDVPLGGVTSRNVGYCFE